VKGCGPRNIRRWVASGPLLRGVANAAAEKDPDDVLLLVDAEFVEDTF
jgi:hypothetical protein